MLLFVLLIAFFVIRGSIVRNIYTRVYDLIEEGNYEEAEGLMNRDVLNGLIYDHGENGEALCGYCYAKEWYEKRGASWAHLFIPVKWKRSRDYFWYFDSKQYAEVIKFYEVIDAEYVPSWGKWQPSKEKNSKTSTRKIPQIKTKKRSTSSTDDRYNMSDYTNAEDFYDDNYYDFMDYYEAEDYYNEHSD